MNRDDLVTLLDFDQWATQKMLELVEPLSEEQYGRDLRSSFRQLP